MAVQLASPSISLAAVPVAASPFAAAAAPEDLAGSRFLGSISWALLAAAWGAWLGYMVESAVNAGAAARIGALVVAAVLVLCGSAAAYVGAAKRGVKEAAGRALMDAIAYAWQGAWLGALVGGGFAAANGGPWVIVVAVGAVLLGGLIGLGVGVRFFGNNLHKTLNSVLWGGVCAGFIGSLWWSPPDWVKPATTAVEADPVLASPAFGPGADWIWRTVGAAPLVVAAFVWWVRWMCEERRKDKENAVGWGMGVGAFLFVAAMAAGVGAIVGGLSQMGCGYVVYHVHLTPTPGTWVGALVALFFWGLGQQPKRLIAPEPRAG